MIDAYFFADRNCMTIFWRLHLINLTLVLKVYVQIKYLA